VISETLELEATPPETKRYQREKLTASIASILLSLALLVVMALLGGPWLDSLIRPWTGPNPWLRLVVLAFFYASTLELLTLPLDFWSGFILEHRYQLSNQTLAGWVWRHIKGYLVAGPIGLILILGLYALLWYSGSWWWLWTAAGWLVVSLVL